MKSAASRPASGKRAGTASHGPGAIGNGDAFAKGRDFAAWLGLVPKQISTRDGTILGKISKRGNRYLRVRTASCFRLPGHGDVLLVLLSPQRQLLGAGARPVHPILGRADPPWKCPLTGGFCCKTILGARAGNIDSRTATKAQHRFNKSFAPIRLLRVSRLLPSFATESDPILTWQSEFWTSLFDPIADFIAPS